MILGIGTDIMDVRRVMRDFGLYRGYFTEAEHRLCQLREERMAAYTKRFAAKEAVIKALGINDAVGGVGFHEIEIATMQSGRPVPQLTGGALRQLKSIVPNGHEVRLHLSVADYLPFAVSYAILEAVASH